MDPELLAWIEQDRERRGRMSGKALFINPKAVKGEKRWTMDTLHRRWDPICRDLGMRITLYEGTRKAFATAALNRDVPKDKLGAMLGHTDPRTTDRYARYRDRSLVTVLRPRGVQ